MTVQIIISMQKWSELNSKWKKHSQRRKHCARAGCSKVRTPPAGPPTRCKHAHRQDR